MKITQVEILDDGNSIAITIDDENYFLDADNVPDLAEINGKMD